MRVSTVLGNCGIWGESGPWLTSRVVLWTGIPLAGLSLLLLAWYVIHHVAMGTVEAGAGDFINYWLGARFAAAGQATLVYDRPLFFSVQQSINGPGADFRFYGYPPVAMLLSLPLAGFSCLGALALWSFSGAALCATVLSRLVGWRLAMLAVIGSPVAFLNLWTGQNGCFTAAIMAGGLMLLQNRPLLSGMVLGLLCYKPHIAVLLPVALLAGAHWRAIIGATASVGSLFAITLAIFGIDSWSAFLDQMVYQRHLLETQRNGWFPGMPTVFSMLQFAPLATAYGAQVSSAIGAAGAVLLVWRSQCAYEIKAAALVLATFLATPYAFFYDTLVLLFAAAWLAREGARSEFLPWQQVIVAALLILPAIMIAGGVFFRLQIAPAVFWLGLVLLVRHCFLERPFLIRIGATTP
jgi:hypothetical protein